MRARRYAVSLYAAAAVLLAGCGRAAPRPQDLVPPPATPDWAQTPSWVLEAQTEAQIQVNADPNSVDWRPSPGSSWQVQLQGRIDTSVPASLYELDMFDTPASTVALLHHKKRRVICYIDMGTAEQWRPDYAKFATILGEQNEDFQERWIDIRRLGLLESIWSARLNQCKAKGFDGVLPDNVDGYQSNTGFPITADDQLAFDRMLARVAHQKGLPIGLQNDRQQIPSLIDSFDFAVDDQCVEYGECSALTPFVKAHKAVFEIEYNLPLSRFCPETDRLGFSGIRKGVDLFAEREACP